jgi:pimeloyl-ACP methyl ester carboxylesterase
MMKIKRQESMNIEGIPAEYKWGKQVVVFSHGFGVRQDNRGLFTELANNLPEGCGYVLFDYNQEKGSTTLVAPPSKQIERFRTILNWVRLQAGVLDVSVVGHSTGCITLALAKPSNLHKAIMLAPPMVISRRTREYFTAKPGASKTGSTWTIPRKDGTSNLIPETLFSELEKISALDALRQYAEIQPYTVVAAGADDVLKNPSYDRLSTDENVFLKTIRGADHNFSGAAREEVADTVNTILQLGRKKVAGGYGGGGYNQ